MAQYIAFAASLGSILLPEAKKKESITPKSEQIVVSNAFAVGIVTGFSLATYIIIAINRHRILERIRHTFRFFLKSQLAQKRIEEQRCEEKTFVTSEHIVEKPISVKCIESRCIGENSLIQILVDPNTSLTSSLHSVRITLKSGTCMLPMMAKGVELYYILGGEGMLSRNGGEGNRMVTGDVITINPWTLRSMSNVGLDDLVFLRISDAGNNCNDKVFDIAGNIDQASNNCTKTFFKKSYDKIVLQSNKWRKYLCLSPI